MRIQCSSMTGWRVFCLLAGCLAALSLSAQAQETGRRVFIGSGAGVPQGGVRGEFSFRTDGSGPHRSIGIMIGGPDGGIDIGSALLKTCDTNQDGVATLDEVKTGLTNWFQKADADTNGALSEVELATALQQIFPAPEPPPGFPAMSEEFALHNLLAKRLMTASDANADGWMTVKEAVAFVEQNFAQWDSDSSGSLDSSEFAGAFAQVMPPPGETFHRRF